jgi:hypothetical protein
LRCLIRKVPAPKRVSTTAAAIVAALLSTSAVAQTIYPIDRADILVGARFDLKVEFAGRVAPKRVKVTVNGVDHATAFGRTSNVPLRERVGTYDKTRFPNYPEPNAEGYPPRVDVSRRLAIFSASSPDYYETFRPKMEGPNAPAVAGQEPRTFEANERYREAPGAMLRLGNLPRYLNASVHSGEDVILTAIGPGSERVRGQLDNTEVFRVMAEALGLGHGKSHCVATAAPAIAAPIFVPSPPAGEGRSSVAASSVG